MYYRTFIESKTKITSYETKKKPLINVMFLDNKSPKETRKTKYYTQIQ